MFTFILEGLERGYQPRPAPVCAHHRVKRKPFGATHLSALIYLINTPSGQVEILKIEIIIDITEQSDQNLCCNSENCTG